MSFWIKNFNYELYNDNRTVIRFNGLIRIFSFGIIHVHTVFMSFLSFLGQTAILKFAIEFNPKKRRFLIIPVYLIPSVLF